MTYFPNTIVALEKVLVRRNVFYIVIGKMGKWKNAVDKSKILGALLNDLLRHLTALTMNVLLRR